MLAATAFQHILDRRPTGAPAWISWAIALLSTFLIFYHVYIGIYGSPTNVIYLPVHLMVALALLFLVHPLGRGWNDRLNFRFVLDFLCLIGCFAVLAYVLTSMGSWELRFATLDGRDKLAAVVAVLLVFEAVRRTVGWALVAIASIFVLHALFANRFPGVFYGPPVSVETLLQALFIGDSGIFGVPVLVMAQYVVLFLLFGRALQVTGAGAFFTRIAFACFGHRVGGPAKAAVISSGLFGTVSGSGVSNVLTTGSFTIPMMRRLGYRPAFAGGVEAAAAVGGAIMPPVMGAVAFMMAEFMGVPYLQIAMAAAIPALLYYFAIYWTVHFEARRLNLASLDRSELPSPWQVLARHGHLGAPLVLIVVLLLLEYSIILVALVATLGTFVLSFAPNTARMGPGRIAEAIEATGRATGSLSATCACAGVIIGSIFATGLSFQVSQAVVGLASQQLWLLLLLAGLIALVLGTGLTASAVYITMVATVIPILKLAGVNDMAAHMFAFYFGVVSDITPPTALAAVAASAIARANPMATMIEASRLGVAAFLVPVLFVYAPGLLMIGTPGEIIQASASAALGLFCLAAALAGFLWSPLSLWRRALLVLAAAALIVPSSWSDVAGATLFALAAAPDLGARLRAGKVAVAAVREVPRDGETAELLRFLNSSTSETNTGTDDVRRWGAWAVFGAVAIGIGASGSASLHATRPLTWLAALVGLSLFTVAGLAICFRRAGMTGRIAQMPPVQAE